MITHGFRYLILFITVLTLGCVSNIGVVKRTDAVTPDVTSQSVSVNNKDNDGPYASVFFQEEADADNGLNEQIGRAHV